MTGTISHGRAKSDWHHYRRLEKMFGQIQAKVKFI
jgi:hypothetical protein